MIRSRDLVGAMLAVVLAASAGCNAAPVVSELVLVVDLGAGLPPGSVVGSIDLRVQVQSDVVVDQQISTSDRGAVPLTLGLRSTSGTSRVVVDATANLVGGGGVSRTVQTHFLPHERRLLSIVLDADCRTLSCPTGSTCIAGSCETAVIDPSTLPVFTGPLPDASISDDAGTPDVGARDVGTRDAGRDVGVTDVGTDAARDAGPDAAACGADAAVVGMPSGCAPRRPPSRPSCDTGTDGMTRTFALLDPVVDQSLNRWATLSYDLDALCTDALASGPSECRPLLDTLGDGPGGSDNSLGESILSNLLMFQPAYGSDVNSAARTGMGVPLVRMSGWNGRDDDDSVSVVVATAVDVLPASVTVPAAMVTFPNAYPDPAWDGTDTAYAATNYFVGGMESVPLIYDDNAYVAGRMLVIALPDRAAFDIPAHRVMSVPGVVRIRLTDAHVIAHLSPDGTSLLDAVLIGRWAYTDVASYLPSLGICPGTPLTDMYLPAFDILLRRSLDLRARPGSGGPGVACDALSVALPFASAPSVHWGGVSPLTLVEGTCP